MTSSLNKRKVINGVFKVLCIFEENPTNYSKYIKRIITELLGYADDECLSEYESDSLYEAAIALKGLIKLEQSDELTHDLVRKIVLHHVNRLQQELS